MEQQATGTTIVEGSSISITTGCACMTRLHGWERQAAEYGVAREEADGDAESCADPVRCSVRPIGILEQRHPMHLDARWARTLLG